MDGWMRDYAAWDEFLETWPVERVRSMTLEEYTKAGSKDTFTHWIESKLSKYGSIWGGSSFKFGVYSRADSTPKVAKVETHERTQLTPVAALDRNPAVTNQLGRTEVITSSNSGDTFVHSLSTAVMDRMLKSVIVSNSRIRLLGVRQSCILVQGEQERRYGKQRTTVAR